MEKFKIHGSGNYCHTQRNINPGSDSEFSGTANYWDCGCQSFSGGAVMLCSQHKALPPILRKVEEPVKVDSLGRGCQQWGEEKMLCCDTEHMKKIRCRVDYALETAGDGQVLRIVEILGINVVDD